MEITPLTPTQAVAFDYWTQYFQGGEVFYKTQL